MTLCIAAATRDKHKPRIVIATDWKAGTEIAGAEIQDKLAWATDNIPVLLAGDVSRAIELKNTYRQFFEALGKRKPPVAATQHTIGDLIRKPAAVFKSKLVNEYINLKYGLPYKAFREAVSKKEIPPSIATETYAEIGKLEFDCELILSMFLANEPYLFKVHSNGAVEECDSFVAIGTGSTIAEGVLYQREQQSSMPLGRTIYHVFEAMKLGTIASGVGKEHTIDVLYPQGERRKKIVGEYVSDRGKRFLERKFNKLGPKRFANMPLPKSGFLEDDF